MTTKREVVIKLNETLIPSLVELPSKGRMFERMQKAIDCSCIGIGDFEYLNKLFPFESVNGRGKYCVVYDDEALLKPNYINPIASYLYGYKDHGQAICGSVIIMKNEMTDEGLDTVGLDNKDVVKILDKLNNLPVSYKKGINDMIQELSEMLNKRQRV